MKLILPLLLLIGIALAVPATAKAETREGTFVLACGFSHFGNHDPIVSPGRTSAHEHTFTGNTSTNRNSTYQSMIAAGSTCKFSEDTAGYWFPTLFKNGQRVKPLLSFFYYKNIPVTYKTTTPFPPNFRMVFGGVSSYPSREFWACFGGSGKYAAPPICPSNSYVTFRINAPNCWDGWQLDSPDHRSHVVYPVSNACPADHPVKLPRGNFFVRYPYNSGGPGAVLSDGTTLPHADFWNTWQQPALVDLVDRCLHAGINCGQIKD